MFNYTCRRCGKLLQSTSTNITKNDDHLYRDIEHIKYYVHFTPYKVKTTCLSCIPKPKKPLSDQTKQAFELWYADNVYQPLQFQTNKLSGLLELSKNKT